MTAGGGATHISTKTGVLRVLTKSDLIIAAGGGGGAYTSSGMDAGGISGSGGNAGTQTTGYMFGQGQIGYGGGGGGLYGGSAPSGAGSGYIGNASLTNKKMAGYKVPTSDAESTKTKSTTQYGNHVTGAAQVGNGYVRIIKKSSISE